MAIETINEPLSGYEIKAILVRRFQALLDRDSTLKDDIQYPGFDFKLVTNIKFHRSVTEGTLVWANDSTGEEVDESDPDTAHDELVVEYSTDSPALARDENELPHPVYEAGPNGPEKKRIMIPEALRRPATKPRKTTVDPLEPPPAA